MESEKPVCAVYSNVSLLLIIIICLSFGSLCGSGDEKKQIKELYAENQTLKSIILKSVDHALISMMKNGYKNENED